MSFPSSVLITGATGFIGQHLLRALKAQDVRCVAITRAPKRLTSKQRSLASWHTLDLVHSDADFESLPKVDAVVHLATPTRRRSNLAESIRINVDATARLCDWAAKNNIETLIHASTMSVYEPSNDLEILHSEDTPTVGASTGGYPLSKRMGEEIATHARQYIDNVTILRPSFVYGPGQSDTGFLNSLAESIRMGQQIRLAKPEGYRLTPVFIDDVVDVICRALAEPYDETLNLGGDEHFTIAELARTLAAHLHEPLAFLDVDEVAASLAIDCSKLDECYPDRLKTPWLEGLKKTWE